MIQIARAWLAAGRSVLWMETERPLRQVLLRFVAQELGLGGSSLHTGHNADPA